MPDQDRRRCTSAPVRLLCFQPLERFTDRKPPRLLLSVMTSSNALTVVRGSLFPDVFYFHISWWKCKNWDGGRFIITSKLYKLVSMVGRGWTTGYLPPVYLDMLKKWIKFHRFSSRPLAHQVSNNRWRTARLEGSSSAFRFCWLELYRRRRPESAASSHVSHGTVAVLDCKHATTVS